MGMSKKDWDKIEEMKKLVKIRNEKVEKIMSKYNIHLNNTDTLHLDFMTKKPTEGQFRDLLIFKYKLNKVDAEKIYKELYELYETIEVTLLLDEEEE